MLTRLSDPPQPPFPQHPQPQQPQVSPVQAPMVYVFEKQRWEHKIVAKNAAEGDLLSERDLNAFGRDGWELVSVVPLGGTLQFYFKRVRT